MANGNIQNEQFDRHRTPRDIAAANWPSRRLASYSNMQYGLATSLVPYVSGDDVSLTRKEFLQMVRDRIDSDLSTGDY